MKKMTLDEFCRLQYPSGITFSPKGGHAVFTLTTVNKEENKYESHLYELKGKEIKQLTTVGRESAFLFLDEDTLLFPADREKKNEFSNESKFYRLSLSGGEAKLAFKFPIPVQKLFVLPNGDLIAVGATIPGYEDLYKGDKKLIAAYLKETKENEDFETVNELPWWWNGQGFTKSIHSSLYYYHVKKNQLERLTPAGYDIFDVKLTPDKKELWYSRSEIKPLLPNDEGISLCRMPIDSKQEKVVFTNRKDFRIIGYEPAESFLFVLAGRTDHGCNTNGDFYKLSYEDGSMTFYAPFNEGLGSSVGSDARYGHGRAVKAVGDRIYYTATLFDSSYLFSLENGKTERLTKKEGSVDGFDVSGEKILTVGMHDMMPPEICGQNGKAITKLNRAALRGKYIAIPEILNAVNGDHDVHGFVLKPFGFEAGKKYPVILDVHGGPKTVYGPVFYHEMQYWASLGYFVIFCNPTGSDGRGDFFDICGKYGTVDYEDIMTFCDEALKAYPEMDEKNFFETGGSYGGFMTNWIIGHTDRFAACASQRSISNWFSFYGVSDIGVFFGMSETASEPWLDTEKMWRQSPLKYADKVKTPTLFIHSFEDYRCPIDQSYQMYSALIAHGVESKMVLFKGENHELSRSGKPLHRIKRLDEITKWFESHKR